MKRNSKEARNSSAKRQRRSYPKPVLERIRDEKGEKWIKHKFKIALKASTRGGHVSLDYFRNNLWKPLYAHSVDPSEDCTEEFLQKIYDQYVRLTPELNDCRLHTRTKQNGYPIHATRLKSDEEKRDDSSSKLQLHQVQWWLDNGCPEIKRGDVFAHRCHNRLCLVHAVKTTRIVNNAQTYCKCFLIVGGELRHVCRHNPQCLNVGSSAFEGELSGTNVWVKQTEDEEEEEG